MAANDFEHGFAFIMEADTEYQFYDALLHHFSRKHPECTLEMAQDSINFEPYYIVKGQFGKRIVRMNSVGTITQLHNSYSWYNSVCLAHSRSDFWTVFLCYDTDSYNSDVSKFYEDDWLEFRNKLKKRQKTNVLDLAARADMEDVFLIDLHGISVFMGLTEDLTAHDVPSGRKGSSRMKQLFIAQRRLGKTDKCYHKGERARLLIDCLDFDKIIESNVLPLIHVEQIFL